MPLQAFDLATGVSVDSKLTSSSLGLAPQGAAISPPTTPGTPPESASAGDPAVEVAPTPAADEAVAADSGSAGKGDGIRDKSFIGIKIGELQYNSNAGQVLEIRGTPVIVRSSYLHSYAEIILNDPKDEERAKIAENETADCEVSVGFVGNETEKVLTGKLYQFGRIPPDGTYVLIIDGSYQLQNNTSSGVQFAGEKPADAAQTEGYEVKSSEEGEISYYGGDDGFDGKQTASGEIFDSTQLTAAHPSAPFGTEARVTNMGNQKQVVVKINDRGPYAGGRILDLSKAAAVQIGMIDSGHAKARVEIVEKTLVTQGTPAGTGNAGKPATQQDSGIATATTGNALNNGDGTSAVSTPVSDTQTQNVTAATAGDATSITSFTELPDLLAATSDAASGGRDGVDPLFSANTNAAGLIYAKDTSFKTGSIGGLKMNLSDLSYAAIEAMSHGDIIVSDGETIKQVSPGAGESTGVVIDYVANRSSFVRNPKIIKKTPMLLTSGFGAMSVTGYNMNDKAAFGATVVTQTGAGSPPPGGVISAPSWGQVNVGDKIAGTRFTWGDATKNGSRIPETQGIMDGIASIAGELEKLFQQFNVSGYEITSWYRDPVANANAGSGSGSRHLQGDAVDFWYPDMDTFHSGLVDSWPGGLAISYGSFVHVDARHLFGEAQARWPYG